ncbi:MAG: aspartate carbamoyltransferase catalytic subunit [Deltaproteobacteria bacterium]|nr:aspartate carbamoyltransferase catalytic subunit [Deltaproteobacteria bacterium]MDZ4224941.1 aspartate carbamoyltransferase catalytic subunit [bacterium]
MSLSQRHILSVNDLTQKDVALILKTAENLEEIAHRPVKKVPALRGKLIGLCFFENSTRTRSSFEVAAKRLSADTLSISTGGSSIAKGETLLDTIKNIEAMQPDLLVVRHASSGVPQFLSKQVACPVINAGDGSHEHPTQALLDLMTILKEKKKIKGLHVAIIGDILNSRVARSNMILLKKMGAKVSVAGPATMIPAEVEQYGVEVAHDIKKIIPKADVIMMLRIQREREADGLFPSLREYARFFGLNRETMRHAKKDAVILHPGPVNRGVEISAEVADGPHSVILDQVSNGVAVRMALLYLMCGVKQMSF